MHRSLFSRLSVVLFCAAAPAFAQTETVATAINQLGLDNVRARPAEHGDENLLLSPYSIEAALAMAFVGADGATRDEMRRVLHLPADDAAVARGFAALFDKLAQMEAVSKQRSDSSRQYGGTLGSIEINVANRLFTQSGFALLPAFTATLRDQFHAPLEEMDFANAAEPSRVKINAWVARETRDKIRDLIPAGALGATTHVVLTNAVYLKAPWAEAFEEKNTNCLFLGSVSDPR
jgi:serpin B